MAYLTHFTILMWYHLSYFSPIHQHSEIPSSEEHFWCSQDSKGSKEHSERLVVIFNFRIIWILRSNWSVFNKWKKSVFVLNSLYGFGPSRFSHFLSTMKIRYCYLFIASNTAEPCNWPICRNLTSLMTFWEVKKRNSLMKLFLTDISLQFISFSPTFFLLFSYIPACFSLSQAR